MFRVSVRALAAITLVLLAGRVAMADSIFYFTITDHVNSNSDYNLAHASDPDSTFQGDIGYGWLEGSPSILGDGSYWITNGQITFAATDDLSSEGTWSLITTNGSEPIGPYETSSQQGAFDVDNLLYPNQDAQRAATSGLASNDQASYLTLWGLLFGSEINNQEINIWGNSAGQNNYSFYSSGNPPPIPDFGGTTDKGGALNNADADETFDLSTVPEPGVLPALLAIPGLSGLWLLAHRRSLK